MEAKKKKDYITYENFRGFSEPQIASDQLYGNTLPLTPQAVRAGS